MPSVTEQLCQAITAVFAATIPTLPSRSPPFHYLHLAFTISTLHSRPAPCRRGLYLTFTTSALPSRPLPYGSTFTISTSPSRSPPCFRGLSALPIPNRRPSCSQTYYMEADGQRVHTDARPRKRTSKSQGT